MEREQLGRRDFLRLSAAATTGVILGACAPAAPSVIEVEKEVPVKEVVVQTVEVEKEVERVVTPTPGPALKAELEYQTRWGLIERGLWDELGPLFYEKHPGIKVTAEPGPADWWDKMLARFVAGTAPDIFSMQNQRPYVSRQAGQLLDLRPYVERDLTKAFLDDFHPKVLGHCYDEISWYGMPYYSCSSAIVWNVDMFDEAGVDHPELHWRDAWGYDEFFEVMSRLVKDENGKRVRWGARMHVWARPVLHDFIAPWGADVVDPDDRRRCALDEPEAQEAMEWLRAAIWDHNLAIRSGQEEEAWSFLTQKVGMVREGPWRTDTIANSAKFRWNLAPFPQRVRQSPTL